MTKGLPKIARDRLTRDDVLSVVSYDRVTGVFIRTHSTAAHFVGKPAGKLSTDGYIQICLFGHRYMAHRVAWLIEHGRWPRMLDHINGNPADNRMVNLRECDMPQNQGNTKRRSDNTSGRKGVYKSGNKWRASIHYRGKTIRLGSFYSIEDAVAARVAGEKQYFGEFARLA